MRMQTNEEPPLDDIIGTAEACARIMARCEIRRAYRRLKDKMIRAAAEEWTGTEAKKRLLLKVYFREFRKSLKIAKP